MSLLSLEHSPLAYCLDFGLYAVLCLAAGTVLWVGSPPGSGLTLLLWVLAGMGLWTLLEYLLHRYVLHGIAPFSRWHAEHHLRPRALVASPVAVTLSLFVLLAALPAWWLLGKWSALALTLGLMLSYLVYGLLHHATHHPMPPWIGKTAWMRQRRMCHALHHAAYQTRGRSAVGSPCHFGVSSSFWDTVFGTNTLARSFRTKQKDI